MMPIKHLNIAVIGSEDLVNGLRLAGINQCFVIKDDHNIGENVREALTGLLDNPDIGIVVMQEDYVKYIEDLSAKLKRDGKMTPVIVEVPSQYGTKYKDVTEHYKEYIRDFIGFDIAI
ncbi:V-type ATP synthase subunit F [Chloroflexota bacterium]